MRVIRLDDAEAEHGPCGPWEGIALIRNWREYYSNAFRERPMTDAAGSLGIQSFGSFAFDSAAGELRKHGTRIKLRGQPIEILAMLLERPGADRHSRGSPEETLARRYVRRFRALSERRRQATPRRP